jgi:hypothetical protein
MSNGAAEGIKNNSIQNHLGRGLRLTDKKIQQGESASNIGRRGRSERADWRNVPQITQFDGPDAQLASIKA